MSDYYVANSYSDEDPDSAGFTFSIKFEGVKSGSKEEMILLQTMLGTAWRVQRT